MSKKICIDFGSSFTKVAVREDWNVQTQMARFDAPVVQSAPDAESQICVPSIVFKSLRQGREEWFFGAVAMGLRAGDGLKAYRNWKNHFVMPQDEPPEDDLLEAAGQFFRWLHGVVRQHPILGAYADSPLRVCVPDFERLGPWRSWFRLVLAMAGWKLDRDFLITEPYANLIGALTLARNCTHVEEDGRRFPTMLGMFDSEQGLLAAIRRSPGNVQSYAALIIDVGAFTTDFGYVWWEDVNDVTKPNFATRSERLGVRQKVDDQIVTVLTPDERRLLEDLNAFQFESMKRNILRGEPYAIIQGGSQHIIGTPQHFEALRAITTAFAQEIMKETERFMGAQRALPNTVLFTGGGLQIPRVEEQLAQYFRGKGIEVFDLRSEERYNWRMNDPLSREEQLERNRLLIRTGSAVGGCSVYVDSGGGGPII